MGPIFNGISEQDQLLRIIKVFGTPNQADCPELYSYASLMKFQFPQVQPTNLSQIFPNASNNAVDLMKHIFKYNPLHRPSCDTLLKHPFFSDLNITSLPSYNTPSNIIQKMQKKQDFEEIYQDNIQEQIKEDKIKKMSYISDEKSEQSDNYSHNVNTEQSEQASQKKSHFARKSQRQSYETDNYTPNDTEFSQQQFSHYVSKHLEEQKDVANQLVQSEQLIGTDNNQNIQQNKPKTPN